MPKNRPPEIDRAELQLSAALGRAVQARAMFGGWGLRAEGYMVAGWMPGPDGDGLKLRVDAETKPDFHALGGQPFIHLRQGQRVEMPYFSLPDAVLNDPERLRPFAEMALRSAQNAKASKK